MPRNFLIDAYSDEALRKIAEDSNTMREFSEKLGYVSKSGKMYSVIKKEMSKRDIDISHFVTHKKGQKRTKENVFIKNSTADQTVLRSFFKKEDVEYICSICGQKPFWNEKPMSLVLDHIDGDNKNDELSNLRWVCPNCNIQLPTTSRRKQVFDESRISRCIDCGIKINCKSTTRCSNCEKKRRLENTSHIPLTRDDLKKYIRALPFVKIGEKFNVSDNAVRKWCKKYKLPYKTRDIKNITDAEWANI